jgi:hypothetical protein
MGIDAQKVTIKHKLPGYTAISFTEGKGYPNQQVAYHPSAFSSMLLSMN